MRAGGIGRVLQSRAEGFGAGDLVQGRAGWQSHPVLHGLQTQKLDLSLGSLEDWVGPLGTSALTAYFGIRDIGALKPAETLLVSAAAGGVGQIAAQIGLIDACRVVGIAGGPEKCQFLRQTLGLHGVIDYKAESDLTGAIRRECTGGVDVYFDNVGGPTLDAALANAPAAVLTRMPKLAPCLRQCIDGIFRPEATDRRFSGRLDGTGRLRKRARRELSRGRGKFVWPMSLFSKPTD